MPMVMNAQATAANKDAIWVFTVLVMITSFQMKTGYSVIFPTLQKACQF
jgi:hypothetical protein